MFGRRAMMRRAGRWGLAHFRYTNPALMAFDLGPGGTTVTDRYNLVGRNGDSIGFVEAQVEVPAAIEALVNEVEAGSGITFNLPSVGRAETIIPPVAHLCTAIMYDHEAWANTPPEEQADLAGSSRRMRVLCDTYGKIYIATLSYSLGSQVNTIEKMAPFAHMWNVLAHNVLEASADLYVEFAIESAMRAKSVNPDIVIQVMVNAITSDTAKIVSVVNRLATYGSRVAFYTDASVAALNTYEDSAKILRFIGALGKVTMIATATLTATGSVPQVNGRVVMTATATLTARGQTSSFAEGKVTMTATATVTARGHLLKFGQVKMIAAAKMIAVGSVAPPPPASGYLLLSPAEIAALPTSGVAWDSVLAKAANSVATPKLCDQNDATDGYLFAKALAWARLPATYASYRTEVKTAIAAVQGTEQGAGCEEGGKTLAANRNLAGYVLAADLIQHSDFPTEDTNFRNWLGSVINIQLWNSGGQTKSVKESAVGGGVLFNNDKATATNGGCHARASIVAIARYLGDTALLTNVADKFQDWLGRSGATYNFDPQASEQVWHATYPDQTGYRGVNKPGTTLLIGGANRTADGIMPEDQKRSGGLAYPFPKEGYVYEGLQGVVLAAELLRVAGYDAWNWESQAIKRIFTWLHTPHFAPNFSTFPGSEVGDKFQVHLVNARYGTNFPEVTPDEFGKQGFGFCSWLYGS